MNVLLLTNWPKNQYLVDLTIQVAFLASKTWVCRLITSFSLLSLTCWQIWVTCTSQIPALRGIFPLRCLKRLFILNLSSDSLMSWSSRKIESPNLPTLVQNVSEYKQLYVDSVKVSPQRNEWSQALSTSQPNLKIVKHVSLSSFRPSQLFLHVDSFIQHIQESDPK